MIPDMPGWLWWVAFFAWGYLLGEYVLMPLFRGIKRRLDRWSA